MPETPYKPEDEYILQDSISSFKAYVSSNTPYTGPIGYLPGYGFLGYSTYQPAEIVISQSPEPLADQQNGSDLDVILEDAALMTGIFDIFVNGSVDLQANDIFYWDEVDGKFAKTPKSSSSPRAGGYRAATEMAKVGKSFAKVTTWVSIAITATQVGRNGLDVNTGADIVICAVGFIPGVGWIIAGGYCIANVIVKETTGNSIPEHAKEQWNEKVEKPLARKMGMLEKYLQNVFFYDWMKWMY
ncbi:hypothetical protein [Bacteroides sp. 224]|uniref:hypothetical protein n=1 Tax=Bacteroides sp. 224 TaxID=2302936 RepID=UPI0013D18313|nr:hypothetical protein [Bacteroides sp. 224]NDV64647.1 hypothetical protein [Bacteroides sp. 224]